MRDLSRAATKEPGGRRFKAWLSVQEVPANTGFRSIHSPGAGNKTGNKLFGKLHTAER
jgi:hypothetical protein